MIGAALGLDFLLILRRAWRTTFAFGPARTTLATRSAGAARWAHLFQLLHLGGGQDLFDLSFHLRFQSRQCFLLGVGEVQLILNVGRKQVESTRPTRPAGPTVTARRTLAIRALIAILGGYQPGGGTQGQRNNKDFCFHDALCLLSFPCADRLHRHDAIRSPVGAQKVRPGGEYRRGVASSNELRQAVFHTPSMTGQPLVKMKSVPIFKTIYAANRDPSNVLRGSRWSGRRLEDRHKPAWHAAGIKRCSRDMNPLPAEYRLEVKDCLKGLKEMPAESVDLVVTSPPYNLGIKYKSYEDNTGRDQYLEKGVKP